MAIPFVTQLSKVALRLRCYTEYNKKHTAYSFYHRHPLPHFQPLLLALYCVLKS